MAACLATLAWAQSSESKPVTEPQLIWESPVHLRLAGDLSNPAEQPKAPFRFVEEDKGGTNPKLKIKDANGKPWTVKWADENHGEIFASRLARAMGYFVRPTFYVREGTIEGAKDLGHAKEFVEEDGEFEDAAFRLVADDMPYFEGHSWSWIDSPFLKDPRQKQYLNGLKILVMLTSNWDAKDARDVREGEFPNTAIYRAAVAGKPVRLLYAVDDWGASMGKWGNFFTRGKWNCQAYQEQTPEFVKGVDDHDFVTWGFTGKSSKEITSEIRIEDVRWLLGNLGKITDRQLEAALRSSGADDEETQCFTKAVRERIGKLQSLVAQSTGTNHVEVSRNPELTSK